MNKMEEIVTSMESIMSGNQATIMEKIGRIGKGELFILKYLSTKTTPITPSEISVAMHASTARISAALASLEKKGQIHREIDLRNRRNTLVTITDIGYQRVRSDLQQSRKLMKKVFSEMGEQDATAFVRLLRRFFEIATLHYQYTKIPKESRKIMRKERALV